MLTNIENTPDGYIVDAYLRDGAGNGHWVRLKNFGDRQGDARDFAEDIPFLSDMIIRMMAKAFDIRAKYRRIERGRYAKQ